MAKVFNFFERFVIRRITKKIIKIAPVLKEKGLDILEKHADEFFEKLEETIVKFIEKHKNQ